MTRGIRLKSLSDIRRFAARISNEVYKGQLDLSTGRALLYGCSILSAIVKDSELEARLENLEKEMKGDSKQWPN